MKTYLKVWFNSDGGKSTTVNDILMSMGFTPNKGKYDYVYKWNKEAPVEDAVKMGDRLHSSLSGCGVYFKLETVEE